MPSMTATNAVKPTINHIDVSGEFIRKYRSSLVGTPEARLAMLFAKAAEVIPYCCLTPKLCCMMAHNMARAPSEKSEQWDNFPNLLQRVRVILDVEYGRGLCPADRLWGYRASVNDADRWATCGMAARKGANSRIMRLEKEQAKISPSNLDRVSRAEFNKIKEGLRKADDLIKLLLPPKKVDKKVSKEE